MAQHAVSKVIESLDRRLAHVVWRANSMDAARTARTPTGFADLDRELPDAGWPASTLIELLVQQAGIGELRLLRPALQSIAQKGCIALVEPPHIPQIAAWSAWGLPADKLLWIKARRVADALWTAEQILKNGSVGALLFWQPQVTSEALRRLQLAAQSTHSTFFLLRPMSAEMNPSPSPLRVAVQPAPGGVSVCIVKRRGPHHDRPLYLALNDLAGTPSRDTACCHRTASGSASCYSRDCRAKRLCIARRISNAAVVPRTVHSAIVKKKFALKPLFFASASPDIS